MAQETFSTYIQALPNAITPFTGSELFYLNQGTASVLASFTTIEGQLIPAWSSFAPSISALTGTITTTGTLSGRYFQLGKIVHVEITASIITNGTGTGAVIFSLPVNAIRGVTGDVPGICGKNSNNLALTVGYNSASSIIVYKYDGTYPGGSGVTVAVNGSYETI